MLNLVPLFMSLMAFHFSLNSVICFSVTSTSLHTMKPIRSCTHRYMNGDAESEARRLLDQAKKLREEVSSIETTTATNADSGKKNTKALYDDEIAPEKDPISIEMRNRLLREASSGLDSDKKQVNVILYISVFVAILVLIGGQGILF